MKNIFFAIALLITSMAYAQTGSVAVHKDPRIDMLLKKQADVNNASTRNSAKRRTARGYRLIVISTNNRNEAIAAKTKVYSYFPELKAYMWHQSPFYKVKVGNFVSRSDAQSYQKRLSAYFPNGVFIMNDTVEIKPEEVESGN
ncbi:MAG: SPOR domain-containing protein [Niabella sp.]